MANILLIGGSGFVSGTLAQLALTQGHQVWSVTRGQRPLPAGVHALTADRADDAAFTRAITEADVTWDLVADCIAYHPRDIRQDLAVFRPRAKHLVYISTDFVLDPAQRQFPQREADAVCIESDTYGGRKRLGELELLHADAGPMRWTVLRPCHIYGPGSLLGCLPNHSRDARFLDHLRSGKPVQLVGGGHFLQQPIFAADLARTILSCLGQEQAHRQICFTAGPDIIESRRYYQIIAEELGVELTVEELPVQPYLTAHPDKAPFLCHRIYDLSKLRALGLHVPATPVAEGLRQQVHSLR